MRLPIIPFHERFGPDQRRSLPAGTRIYAIGDIHGRLDLLDKCLALIEQDLIVYPAFRPILVFLGDYIDRGPSSRETVDRLIECNSFLECVLLKGNHELIAIRCLTDRSMIPAWLKLGGAETLVSYGITPLLSVDGRQGAVIQMALQQSLPQSHFVFFRNLQNSFTCGDFFFVHGGVNPIYPLSGQKENDLLWIRDPFLNSQQEFGKIVVHGHTPVEALDVRKNRINIDTGAYATGRLTCLIIENDTLAYLDTKAA